MDTLPSHYLDPITHLPTPAYRKELLRMASIIQIQKGGPHLHQIRQTLMHWEEEALTGIIRVTRRERDARPYIDLIHRVWGSAPPFQHSDGSMDLANSTLVLTINELKKGLDVEGIR